MGTFLVNKSFNQDGVLEQPLALPVSANNVSAIFHLQDFMTVIKFNLSDDCAFIHKTGSILFGTQSEKPGVARPLPII